jgi:rhamnogalacturonyl hydrolase YesR
MNFWLFILLGSIFLNLLFIYFDIFPYLYKRFVKEEYLTKESLDVFSPKIYEAAEEMIDSNKTFMKMSERNDFIARMSLIINGKEFKEFKKYSYPKAFLFLGVLKYLFEKKDESNFSKIKKRFDELYLLKDGDPAFKIDKVDQTVFGQVALLLFKYRGEKKYKFFADSFYNYLQYSKSSSGIILYRKNSKVQYVDLLGMICPFLIEYGLQFKNNSALNLAYKHMNYWIEKGLDRQSHLPFHCVHIETSINVGPTNWGRGIAWYGLGLSYIVANTNKDNNPFYEKFSIELNALLDTLDLLKNKDSLWGQFPGNPDGNGLNFDASASTSILYMSVLTNRKSSFQSEICKYTTIDGFVDFTSGDTEGVSQYSRAYSKSEFSQGMLLLYLSELNKHKIVVN